MCSSESTASYSIIDYFVPGIGRTVWNKTVIVLRELKVFDKNQHQQQVWWHTPVTQLSGNQNEMTCAGLEPTRPT